MGNIFTWSELPLNPALPRWWYPAHKAEDGVKLRVSESYQFNTSSFLSSHWELNSDREVLVLLQVEWMKGRVEPEGVGRNIYTTQMRAD